MKSYFTVIPPSLVVIKVKYIYDSKPNIRMNQYYYNLAWLIALVAAVTGVAGVGARVTPHAWWVLAAGGGVLAALAIYSAWQTTHAKVGSPVGGVLMLVLGSVMFYLALVTGTSGLFGNLMLDSLSEIRKLMIRTALIVTGLQAFFLAINVRITGLTFPERVIYPVFGHGLLLAATSIIVSVVLFQLPLTPANGAILAWATGLSVLVLHTFWLGQRADSVTPPRPRTVHRFWEQTVILVLVIGVVSVGVVSISMQTNVLIDVFPTVSQARAASIVAVSAAAVAVAMLAAPTSSPKFLRRLTSPVSTIVQHSLILLLLGNALVIALLLLIPAAYLWVLGAYLVLLLIGVTVEYVMIAHAHHRLNNKNSSPQNQSQSVTDASQVTVVVPAFAEAEVLPESLDHNLKALEGVPFVIVPAEKSTDGTVDVAYEYQEKYPERVRVSKGKTGSKAGDLNQVWETIDTPRVLILDADETVDAEFLNRGQEVLDTSPSVGIVQGRKAELDPDESSFTRFVTAERRHSTWLDHTFMHDVAGASHFAGSAALFRHEVPPAVDGWSEDTLTEDIDLTLRLYLQTDWRIEYVPDMHARVLNPKDTLSLVQQRRRWARGWVKGASQHGIDIVRAGPTLGWRRSLGLSWVLFTTVSTPLYTVFPGIILLGLLGFGTPLPLWMAAVLALVILPAKAISFGYAAVHDPLIPIQKTPTSIVGVVVHAYIWILMAWLIQLHALYLHLAGAPQIWTPTTKAPRADSS